MPHTTHVTESKVNITAQEALQQIDDKGYALTFAQEEWNIVKIGILFSINTKTIEDYWIISNE
ncbi:MAG: PD-(D/E)XK nuclease domain-containing protein [Prevotella sp.]|nr:PD-(D/E)XK nuclease domain-containing protein [Prevotella sp.]